MNSSQPIMTTAEAWSVVAPDDTAGMARVVDLLRGLWSYYADRASVAGIERIVRDKRGEVHFLEQPAGATALVFKYSPALEMYRVHHIAFSPEIDPLEALKTNVARCRAVMDDRGLRRMYSLSPKRTGAPELDEYIRLHALHVWEIAEERDSGAATFWLYDRDPNRHGEDNLWRREA